MESNDKVKVTDNDGEDFVSLSDEESRVLCQDYANFTRVGLAEEHGQIVNSIATIEEQLHTFSQLLELVGSDNTRLLTRTLPSLSTKFELLQPSLQQVDRLEELVSRARRDMDLLEGQLGEAEATVESRGAGLSNMLKIPLNIISKQLGAGSTEGSSGGVSPQGSGGGVSPQGSGGGVSPPTPEYRPPDVFSTEEYFPKKA